MSTIGLLVYVVAILLVAGGSYLLGRRSVRRVPVAAVRGGEPSPTPWISDAVWQQRHQWERFGNLRGPEDTEGPLLDAETYVVSATERAAAPVVAFPRPPAVPRDVDPTVGDRLLRQTPEIGAFFRAARWPVCCQSMTVLRLVQPTTAELVGFERAGSPLDAAVVPPAHREGWALELGSIRAGGRAVNGVNVFHCAVCGRVYGVYSVP